MSDPSSAHKPRYLTSAQKRNVEIAEAAEDAKIQRQN